MMLRKVVATREASALQGAEDFGGIAPRCTRQSQGEVPGGDRLGAGRNWGPCAGGR
jgi:hypothetical protein